MLKDPKTLISVFLFIRNGNNKGAQLIRRTMKATQSKHLMIMARYQGQNKKGTPFVMNCFKSKWILKEIIYEFEMDFKKSFCKQYNLSKYF